VTVKPKESLWTRLVNAIKRLCSSKKSEKEVPPKPVTETGVVAPTATNEASSTTPVTTTNNGT
jgi:hypothetical protein